MTGILGPYMEELEARSALAGVVASLPLSQLDQIAALALDVSVSQLDEVGAAALAYLEDLDRREVQRARIWEIERKVCEMIPAEVSAEIDRATSAAPVIRDHSEATRRQYGADQAHFAVFCARQGVAPMPAEPAVLALYILETAAPALLRRRLAALADLHRQCARILPRKHAIVLAAIRHVNETTKAEDKDNGQTPAGA